MAINFFKPALLFLVLVSISACAPGILYTDIITPLTVNMDNTPVGTSTGSSASKQITDPVVGLKVSWSSTAIGDAMKKANLKQANFADLRTRSYFFGVWQRQTVLVNGN